MSAYNSRKQIHEPIKKTQNTKSKCRDPNYDGICCMGSLAAINMHTGDSTYRKAGNQGGSGGHVFAPKHIPWMVVQKIKKITTKKRGAPVWLTG